MTLVQSRYFDKIVGRLRRADHDVRHFALLARRETVLRRLRSRGLGPLLGALTGPVSLSRREGFAVVRLDFCLTQLARPDFAEQLWTDRLSVSQVADRIATSTGLRLTPARGSRFQGWLRRAQVATHDLRLRR